MRTPYFSCRSFYGAEPGKEKRSILGVPLPGIPEDGPEGAPSTGPNKPPRANAETFRCYHFG